MKNSVYISIAILGLVFFNSCKKDEEAPCPDVVKEPIVLNILPFYNGTTLELNQLYQSNHDNPIWFTKKKFYLSNIVAIKQDGSKQLISEISILDFSLSSSALQIQGNIEKGDYTSIQFDLGVREDLNQQDPATYPSSHPLSVTQNMYWGWSTQYVFSKFEGFEVSGTDTVSFVIHTGTQDLYRPEISVPRTFTVASGGGNSINVNMDLYQVLVQPEYTFNLTDSSQNQSHTTDNLQLAVHYMDNFTKAFN